MKKAQIFLGLLLVTFAFVSCDPSDNDSNSNDNFSENFGSAVDRSFIGQVVDTDNHALQNVTISIGTSTVQTDVNGVFIINDANVYEKFAHITATKAGYIDGSRSLVPTTGKNNVKIMLIPNTPLQTIQSGVASEVALPSGTKVNFDGAFKDESGASYSGDVQVSMFHLKSSDTNISSLMPGMLYAERENGDEAALETFGMLNVELRGSAGQKLNIANGHTAQITMKIDDTQTATAPSSIPLWHFDEEGGYWKEDGQATKVGSNYVGTVSHFSWWNCDIPNSSIVLSFTIVDSNGNPVPNIYINLINPQGYHASGMTDDNGQLSGILPANQALTINVYNSTLGEIGCGIVYSASVGPYTSDTIVPTITLDSTAITTSNVVGTLLKCNSMNVTNGYIMLSKYGSHSYIPVTNGAFSFNETYCAGNTSFTLKGVDFDNLQETDSISYNFTEPITNVGNLQACNTISEFASYQIDGNTPVILTQESDSGVGSGIVLFYANFYDGSHSLGIVGNNVTGPGIYSCPPISLVIDNTQFYSITNTIQFNISQIGAIGEYIDLTFYGTYNDATGPHTITGAIHTIVEN